MVRFLHTSDWQLGLKLRFVPDPRRPRAQLARFQAVERIADLALQHEVDAVVVAGDVFDDNAVGRDVLQQARDAMARFGQIPLVLLPGNHDPATPDAALGRLAASETVHVLTEAEPWTGVEGAVFYPCPVDSHIGGEDPTAWVGRGEHEGLVRVAVAHGAAIDFSEESESPRPVDVERLLERGVDYVALGDWHGVLEIGPRAWYCGAPEATRFKERRPGHALLVEIDGPGAVPRVTELDVARTRWLREKRTVQSAEDLDGLESWLDALEDRSTTLLEVRLDGALPYDGLTRLDALLERTGEELLWLKVRENRVGVDPSAEDLDRLRAEGFVGAAADELRHLADDEQNEARPVAVDALRLLYRLLGEAEEGGS